MTPDDQHNARTPTPGRGDLLWQVVDSAALGEPTLLILSRATVEHWMARLPVLRCSTWGELRSTASPEVYREVCDLCGHGSFEAFTQHLGITGAAPLPNAERLAAESFDPDAQPPTDATPFSASDDIGACADGEWPPAVAYMMNQDLPDDVLDAYADRYETVLNGVYATIRPDKQDAVLEELERRGHRLSEDDRLEVLANCLF